jgi:uncharacterized membrane protein YqaE (UPF0057 family)
MKKMILGTVAIFVASLFLVSCSSECDVLGSFSKRKYLKNIKEKKVKYEDKVEDLELASTKKVNSEDFEFIQTAQPQIADNTVEPIVLTKVVQKKAVKSTIKEMRDWNKYNRSATENFLVYNNKAGDMHDAFNKVSVNSKQVDDVVLIILGIFIPPLAVYLYEDAITANFWVDLLLTFLFWIPGIIFAMLVMFADVSV